MDENLEIKPGKSFPDPLPDLAVGAVASWEVDIWKKLRTAKKAATLRYLATVDGKNFMVTNLIAEIASSYYELMALDNLLDIVQKNITIQTDAFEIVKQQKNAAKLTQREALELKMDLIEIRKKQMDAKVNIYKALGGGWK